MVWQDILILFQAWLYQYGIWLFHLIVRQMLPGMLLEDKLGIWYHVDGTIILLARIETFLIISSLGW